MHLLNYIEYILIYLDTLNLSVKYTILFILVYKSMNKHLNLDLNECVLKTEIFY